MHLQGYPIVLSLPVLWADMDLFGHVNNTIYLKWFESARVAYWDGSFMRDYMQPRNLGPILASIKCDYKLQIRYPDQIEVSARAARIGRTSITMEHEVYSDHHGAVAAAGESVIVMFDYQHQQKYEITGELREIIEQCEARAN